MPQKERPEELLARQVVERALGVQLQFSDTNGGVDYRFQTLAGATAALEVTTVTSGAEKTGMAAWVQARMGNLTPSLASCWHVSVDSKVAVYKTIISALEPLLARLEAVGVKRFDTWGDHLVFREVGPALALLGVIEAHVIAVKPGVRPQVFLSPVSSYVSSGSDEALVGVEVELASRTDNARKLHLADVVEHHLYVWLDDDSPGQIRAPLDSRPGEGGEPSILPERDPEVDPIIDAVWIVHSRTRVGWRWLRGHGWHHVDGDALLRAADQVEIRVSKPDPRGRRTQLKTGVVTAFVPSGEVVGMLSFGIGPGANVIRSTDYTVEEDWRARGIARSMCAALMETYPDCEIVEGGGTNTF